MSMSVAVGIRGSLVVATDRRWTSREASGRAFSDIGGKLIRTPDGWLTFTGKGASRVINLALRQLSTHARVTAFEVEAALRLATGNESGSGGGRCHFILSRGDSARIARVSWEGGEVHSETGAYVLSTPFSSAEDQRAISLRLRHALQSAANRYDVVRTVAAVFAESASASSLLSEAVEIGVGELYLSAPAAEVAHASDQWIERALRRAQVA